MCEILEVRQDNSKTRRSQAWNADPIREQAVMASVPEAYITTSSTTLQSANCCRKHKHDHKGATYPVTKGRRTYATTFLIGQPESRDQTSDHSRTCLKLVVRYSSFILILSFHCSYDDCEHSSDNHRGSLAIDLQSSCQKNEDVKKPAHKRHGYITGARLPSPDT